MRKMVCACSRKMVSTSGLFHLLISRVRRSATTRSLVAYVGGPKGSSFEVGDIHESDQILVVFPLPMAFPSCSFKTWIPARTPLHPWDADAGHWAVRRLELWQYLPSKSLASKPSGFVNMRQEFLASMARLKSWTSRKPSPPRSLCCERASHEIQQIFRVEGSWSHQKRVRADLIWSQRPIGNGKHDMEYVGVADSTAFSMVSLPAADRRRVEQDAARSFIRM